MVLQREKVLHMTLMQEIVLGCMDVSEVSTLISECLKIVVCQEIHGESMKSNTWQQLSQITEEGNSSAKHGHPRKRQKQYMEEKFFSEEKFSSLVSSKDLNWQEKYISVISKLKPGNKLQSDIEKSLASLRVCARVFGPFLETPLWNEIAECLNCWLTHVVSFCFFNFPNISHIFVSATDADHRFISLRVDYVLGSLRTNTCSW